jgi:cysteinyl-tRNA synthetase
MALKVYNTQTRKKEVFVPITGGKVGLYVCGITAYDQCHVGHARSAVVFDVIARFLSYLGYEVTFVKNFTDVDDKIISKANASRSSIKAIADRYIREHNDDMDAIGVKRPVFSPRATDHIDGMIELIENLLVKEMAYVSDGDVYYSVERFAAYGKLSGRNLNDMLVGARIDANDKKRNYLDFALWKKSKEEEPFWESPWGKGRPGWHIECSVMSQKYLGETLDIHGGGEDLIFPHHENEIAQSEGATGKPFANYWIHNGFVKVDHEKMSKSTGNFFTIRSMLERYHPEVLRLFILQSHYRSPLDFSENSIAEVRSGLDRFYALLKAAKDILRTDCSADEELLVATKEMLQHLAFQKERFVEAMEDDFNTARAIGHLFEIVRQANHFFENAPKKVSFFQKTTVAKEIQNILLASGEILGLFHDDPDEYFRKSCHKEAAKRGLDVVDIENLIEERNIARSQKEWQRADEIRNILTGRGVTVKDSPSGTSWIIE